MLNILVNSYDRIIFITLLNTVLPLFNEIDHTKVKFIKY